MSYSTMKKALLSTLALVFSIAAAHGQAPLLHVLETLETRHQACLDKGTAMLGCSQTYYAQMDSLLNVVYKEILRGKSPTQKEQLKKEQLEWLKQRDAKFKALPNEVKEETDDIRGADFQMILLDKKADIVAERITELLGSNNPD